MESGNSTVTTGSGKQEKKDHEKEKENEGEDIISKLHESIIRRILSFLPTEDAVGTSVLSKSWNMYHWTTMTITKLDLNDSVYYTRNWGRRRDGDQQHFVNFMNRAILVLTKGASNMESISLTIIKDKYDASLLNTWVSSIFHRSPKHVDIRMDYPFSEGTPPFSPLTSHSFVNSSTSLEELSLQGCWGIKIPTTHVHFGCLKSLMFRGIEFTVDSSGGDHLTLSLPVLKKFEMYECRWLNAKDITVEAPLLEIIDIVKSYNYSASGEPPGSAITFSVLHLKKFSYSGCYDTSRTVTLSDPSSAHNASARVYFYCSRGVPETRRVLLLLKQFSQMKCIDFIGLQFLTLPELAILPVFAMLSHLVLRSFTGEVLLGLLHRSPVLKTLTLEGICKFSQLDLFNSTAVPDCLASTLRIVKFEAVTKEKHELCMVLANYFMENGMVMEKISFSPPSRW